MTYVYDNHRPLSEQQRKNSFMRGLWRTYEGNPEARQFLARLGKKQRRNRKLRKNLGKV